MKFKSEGARMEWDRAVEVNDDDYGSGVIRFCARWAGLMEVEMEHGARLEDIADETRRRANKGGVNEFQEGLALSVLSTVWAHGDELRRWHQQATQGTDADVREFTPTAVAPRP